MKRKPFEIRNKILILKTELVDIISFNLKHPHSEINEEPYRQRINTLETCFKLEEFEIRNLYNELLNSNESGDIKNIVLYELNWLLNNAR